ncbi:phosphoribosylglycinamide synthetase [Dactylonectria estremocensis]|uniref:Phosphoribosylglycinamide synthetase n=1 Tax=Dactylonectria estremocensis TaxID=1079267 RepID=A0A9P9JIR0_9HYPO|nr:phosphoribosylglycinamide synthetase [Dactylonectria estremocensis]
MRSSSRSSCQGMRSASSHSSTVMISSPLPPGQDHKSIFDGSRGPNTGGMGVYGPTDSVFREWIWKINRDNLAPTIQGPESDGHPFRGMLFTGVMITPTGSRVQRPIWRS